MVIIEGSAERSGKDPLWKSQGYCNLQDAKHLNKENRVWKAASQIKSRIAQAKALWQVGTRWTQELREGQSGQDRRMAMKMERGQGPDHPRFLKVRSFIFIPRAMGNDSSVWMCVCDV